MGRDKVFVISLLVMIVAALTIGINAFVTSLPDLVIRVAGVITLVALLVFSYSLAKLKKGAS